MTTASPAPFPNGGLRQLSAKEQLQRLKALSCSVPQDNKPKCSGQVFAGIFFDGTGNNMQVDYYDQPAEKRKHSNVVKLFQTHRDNPSDGYIRIYVPGVGTPFPEIGDGGGALGSANSFRGEDRIIWGLLQLINAPHRFVTKNPLIPNAQADTIVGNVASSFTPPSLRRLVLRTWQEKLAAALEGKKPRVEQINVSVFGFSRGAAEARVFVNWLFEVCEQKNGGWTLAGIPLRVMFLGIWDTVASVGLPSLLDGLPWEGHQSWADQALQIHPAVEQCLHFVAGHEVRACFPLDSACVKSKYPANVREVLYPGAHSDVGGGYAPGALGVSHQQNDFLAIIPGVRMYHEARKAGVPLEPFARLDRYLQQSLTPSDSVVRSFNAYLADAKVGNSSVDDMHRRHMSLYFSHRFKQRHKFFSRNPYNAAAPNDQRFLKTTQNSFIERLAHLSQGDPMDPDFDAKRAAALHKAMLKAAGLSRTTADKYLHEVAERVDPASVTPAMEEFFDRYIHDSMAGFISQKMNEYALNGIGITKFREVYKGNDE
ncbi:T6SS phospholipase effector Tle1-like catalytic domain-containing protein [Caldimonas brevitalea]|uniref:T6SS Phospholipase effector Tle1-like catalytic domain-containing protein n=1 Tax=Caldimonas brevitalea TaxID=413882 RepID=A0A0G3BLW8_9BURK|nr:DUF2235 domain-containing protein [Caldimonas brevitalea]AKJ27555.1 hypothetical protein AAW51_0864 [Caldimonas brevitalea]